MPIEVIVSGWAMSFRQASQAASMMSSYLLRGLKIVEPNHVWAADVSVPQEAA